MTRPCGIYSRHPGKPLPIQLLLVAVVVLLVSGCSRDVEFSEREYLKRASVFEDQKDLPSAIIELKNALRTNPLNFDSRWRLGRLYLRNQQGQLAEKELRNAFNIQPGIQSLRLDFAKALLSQSKFEDVLSLLTDDTTTLDQNVTALTLRGKALVGLFHPEEAKSIFETALDLEPESIEASLGLAQASLENNEWPAAERLIDSVLETFPENVEALILQADLFRLEGKSKKAIDIYSKAIDLDPINIEAHLSRAQIFLSRGNFDAAIVDAELLEKYVPKYPVARYVQAMIEYGQGQYGKAEITLLEVLKIIPNHPPSLLLMASIQQKGGSFEAAVSNLDRYLDQRPNDIYARKLLAEIQLSLGNPEEAVKALTPVANTSHHDYQLSSILGSAYIQTGDTSKATQVLKDAVSNNPGLRETMEMQTTLGLLQAANNQQQEAISTLERAFKINENSIGLNAIMALLYLQDGDYKSAHTHAEKASITSPQSALGPYLHGLISLKEELIDSATDYFKKSLYLQENYLPAVVALGQIEVKQGHKDALKQRLEKLLDNNTNNIEILTRLAMLAESRENFYQAIDYWDRATQVAPDKVQPQLSLVDNFLRVGDTKGAVKAATKARESHSNVLVLEAFGVAKLRNGDSNEAKDIFLDLVTRHPSNSHYRLRLAQAQMSNGESLAAVSSLELALKYNPDSLPALSMLANYKLEQASMTEALTLAKRMVDAAPESPDALFLLGKINTSLRKYENATEAFEKAFALLPNRLLMSKLFQTYRLSKNHEASYVVLRRWMETHPQDTGIRLILGNSLLTDGKSDQAIDVYRQLVEANPKSAEAHNNLAYLLFKKGDKSALSHAESAYRLSPKNPAFADTYGWLLIQSGHIEKGLELLKETIQAAPHLRQVRYHLAVAYYKNGYKEQAKNELMRALREGDFEDQDKAATLLDEINKG